MQTVLPLVPNSGTAGFGPTMVIPLADGGGTSFTLEAGPPGGIRKPEIDKVPAEEVVEGAATIAVAFAIWPSLPVSVSAQPGIAADAGPLAQQMEQSALAAQLALSPDPEGGDVVLPLRNDAPEVEPSSALPSPVLPKDTPTGEGSTRAPDAGNGGLAVPAIPRALDVPEVARPVDAAPANTRPSAQPLAKEVVPLANGNPGPSLAEAGIRIRMSPTDAAIDSDTDVHLTDVAGTDPIAHKAVGGGAPAPLPLSPPSPVEPALARSSPVPAEPISALAKDRTGVSEVVDLLAGRTVSVLPTSLPVPLSWAQSLPGAEVAKPIVQDILAAFGDESSVLTSLPVSSAPLAPGGQAAPIQGVGSVPLVVQIAETVLRSTQGATEIALSPEELGRVQLLIQADAQNPDRLVVHLTFDRPDTMDLFRRHSDQLTEALRAAGYAEVSLGFGSSGSGQGPGSGKQSLLPVESADPVHMPEIPPPLTPSGVGLDLRL